MWRSFVTRTTRTVTIRERNVLFIRVDDNIKIRTRVSVETFYAENNELRKPGGRRSYLNV